MDEISRKVRHFVYETFQHSTRAPYCEEIMKKFNLTRKDVETIIDNMHDRHLIHKIPNAASHRILFAWPFSNLPTPHQVVTESNKTYYGCCICDAIAIPDTLQEDGKVKTI